MTTREAFERGTDTFNAHDIHAFADVLADDAVFVAPGGMRGEGKAACVTFYGSWFDAFPDAHVEVHGVHITDDLARGGHIHGASQRRPSWPHGRHPTNRPRREGGLHSSAPLPQLQHVSFNLMFDRLLMLEQLGLIPAPAA